MRKIRLWLYYRLLAVVELLLVALLRLTVAFCGVDRAEVGLALRTEERVLVALFEGVEIFFAGVARVAFGALFWREAVVRTAVPRDVERPAGAFLFTAVRDVARAVVAGLPIFELRLEGVAERVDFVVVLEGVIALRVLRAVAAEADLLVGVFVARDRLLLVAVFLLLELEARTELLVDSGR